MVAPGELGANHVPSATSTADRSAVRNTGLDYSLCPRNCRFEITCLKSEMFTGLGSSYLLDLNGMRPGISEPRCSYPLYSGITLKFWRLGRPHAIAAQPTKRQDSRPPFIQTLWINSLIIRNRLRERHPRFCAWLSVAVQLFEIKGRRQFSRYQHERDIRMLPTEYMLDSCLESGDGLFRWKTCTFVILSPVL